MAGRGTRGGLSWMALAIGAAALLGVVVDPARVPPPPRAEGRARPSPSIRILAAPTPLTERRIKPKERLGGASRVAGDPYERVASSLVVRGVRLLVLRRSSPAERIAVITVAPWARVRAVLVPTGPRDAPFATVSSAVDRVHGLAGVHG